jgi:hypothetical protein
LILLHNVAINRDIYGDLGYPKDMKATHKRSFYLEPEIEEALAKAPPKKASERANELMRKGLLKEREEAMALEYKRYGEATAKQNIYEDMTSTALAYRLSEDDDSEDLV